MPPTRFGLLLKSLRKERGLSQKALGEKAGGLSYVTIGDWERGKRNPLRYNVKAIADALETPPDELMAAAGFAADGDPTEGLIERILPTGEVIYLSPDDDDPDRTAEETAVWLQARRQLRQQVH